MKPQRPASYTARSGELADSPPPPRQETEVKSGELLSSDAGKTGLQSPTQTMGQLHVPAGFQGMRADQVLAEHFPQWSRTLIQKSFQAGTIQRQGHPLRPKDKLNEGDCIDYCIEGPTPCSIQPIDQNLVILYEDADVVAIDKPPGQITHPGHGQHGPTLVEAVLGHTHGKLSRLGGPERPGVVHRLDKETSGVILFAKTDAAYLGLIRSFAQREAQKTYLAFVQGHVRLQAGKREGPIGRHPHRRTQMQVQPQGRPATTFWERVRLLQPAATVLHCFPQTGRTHQIRVHLADWGHPILGDSLYGYRSSSGFPTPPRICLHAQSIELPHPIEKEKMLQVSSPFPADLAAYLENFKPWL